jgi:phospholipid/cholesterol/gamma-HCH transport system ATP-binding protein
MIEVINLRKSFDGREVLKGISFVFEPGKINLVIGQSGSGKSVLIKNLVGLLEPEEGKIMYNDRDFTALKFKQKKEIRKEIGMVFQGGALFDSETVEDNVRFPLEMFTNMSDIKKQERVDFCLNRVHLDNVHNLYPAEISGGMQKRVAIARAIALNPKYLFFDEPNSGLDPITSLVIDKLIKEITIEYNITTIINSHDMNSVMEIGDKIMFVYEGNNWWNGTKEDLFHADNKELNDFVFASDLFKMVKERVLSKE